LLLPTCCSTTLKTISISRRRNSWRPFKVGVRSRMNEVPRTGSSSGRGLHRRHIQPPIHPAQLPHEPWRARYKGFVPHRVDSSSIPSELRSSDAATTLTTTRSSRHLAPISHPSSTLRHCVSVGHQMSLGDSIVPRTEVPRRLRGLRLGGRG
jgi:hypothetical protein